MGQTMKTYEEALAYLYGLQKFGIKFGLSKTSTILEGFGNPHVGRKYIHVAGTNGKGSVAAFLASVLKEAGFRVGLYSSPHLVRFTERFRINGREMDPARVTALANELRKIIVAEEPPTFFEATTAMALVHFAREETDIAVMEVGMGGRLDATNIITPMVSAITNISLEHKQYLGARLMDIAGEKGGIIKPGVDVVSGAVQPAVIRLFRDLCREQKAPFWQLGKDVHYRKTASGVHYYGRKWRFRHLRPGLQGQFQARNAALALAVLERLAGQNVTVSERAVRDGVAKTQWPGRMHVVSTNPTIILDGSHNPAAVRALARSITADYAYRRLILVIGIMADKEIPRILGAIVPLADYVFYSRPAYPRAADPERLSSAAAHLGTPGEVIRSLEAALDKAKRMADAQDLIVVCGSLFTVGEALTHFDPVAFKPDAYGGA